MARITHERKEQRREEILSAAIALFARKGYHGVNTAEIAERAGIAEGTIFRYFPTKDELLIRALESVVGRLCEELRREDDPNGSTSDRLMHFIRNHLRLIRENPDLARFLIIELRQAPEFLLRYPQYNRLGDYIDLLRDILRTGMERGDLRRVDIECTVVIIFGTMDYVLTRWLLNGSEMDLECTITQLRDIIYNGLKPEVS